LFKAVNRQDLLAALVLLLSPLLLFWSVTIGPNTLLPVDNLFAYEPWLSSREALGVGLPQNQLLSDLILENYIWKKFLRDAIEAGQIPLWNPYILSGQPFLANGQHSGLYPFSLLFYVMPLSKAYGWFTVLQLWLAGLNMYVFGRVLRLGRWGALVAGLTYSLSGFFIVRVVFTMIVAGAVWLPLLLAFIEIIIRKQEEKGPAGYSPIPYVVAGSAVLGMQALAGHVEITYYTLLVSGYYAAIRLLLLWWRQRSPKFALRLAGWLLAMVLLGLGVGAVQLVPMYEVVTQNFRDSSVTLAEVRGWALPLRRVASFVIPDFFGSPAHHGYFDVVSRTWQPLGLNANGEINPLCANCTSWDTKTAVEAGAYLGILPLVLAALAVANAMGQLRITNYELRDAQESRFAIRNSVFIFAALAVISLLFAFGTPLYGLLFYGLPGWNQLHSPFRWIFPYTLSVSLLAGIGVAYLKDEGGRLTAEVKKFILQPLALILFFGGLAGLAAMLTALALPAPFIELATAVFSRSGLAQNAFADGRQFFGYQWPNFVKFFAMVTASGVVLLIYNFGFKSQFKIQNSEFKIWLPLATVVIAIDLFLAGWGFNPSVDAALLDFKPNVVRWLEERQAEEPLFRINSFDTATGPGNKVLLANAGMYSNLFDVRGYDSIIPAQYSRFMQAIQPNGDLLFNRVGPIYHPGYAELDSALLDFLGVRYMLTTQEIGNPNYALVYNDEIKVYENLDALPRAFLVDEGETMAGADPAGWTEDFIFALRSLNPRQKVLLDPVTNGLGRNLSSDDAGPLPPENSVRISQYTPIEIKITVQTDQLRWLVLADTFFSGWRAYAKRQNPEPREDTSLESEIRIHRANGAFRAVLLPPGTWEVRFRYSPRSFQFGAYTSFLSAALLLFLAGYWAWGKVYRETESDSAIKRVAKNSLVPMVMALSNRLIDFAFALLMLRILQPEGAGKYAFAVAFIGLAEILTRFGLGTLVTRDVAADRGQTNRYLSNVSILRGYLWLAALPVMAAVLGLYVLFGDNGRDVLITIGIFAIGTFFSNLSDGLTAVFYAHEKAEYPAGVSAITTFTRVTIGALVLLLGWGIVGLAGASLAANLVSFSVLLWLLITKIYRPHFESDAALRKEMMGQSFPLMINHLLSTIFFRIDVFILKPIWGSREVGYYSAAYKYIDGINVIPQYFTLAIFPLMSRFAADSRESLVRAYLLSLRLLLMLALPIAAGTPFVAYELILFLAGPEFIPDSMIVLQLLIWFLPFSFVNQVTQYVLIAINQQRALTRAFVIGVVFNTVTNLMFIPLYGYRAAAITTIFSEWALLIPFYLLVRKHLCTVPWVDVVWRPTVAAGVMAGVLWLIGDINFFVTLLVAGVVYSVTLAAVGGLNQQDMQVVWRAIPLKRLLRRG
jgi:O-antigen/teichoic acid export membrane protein